MTTTITINKDPQANAPTSIVVSMPSTTIIIQVPVINNQQNNELNVSIKKNDIKHENNDMQDNNIQDNDVIFVKEEKLDLEENINMSADYNIQDNDVIFVKEGKLDVEENINTSANQNIEDVNNNEYTRVQTTFDTHLPVYYNDSNMYGNVYSPISPYHLTDSTYKQFNTPEYPNGCQDEYADLIAGKYCLNDFGDIVNYLKQDIFLN